MLDPLVTSRPRHVRRRQRRPEKAPSKSFSRVKGIDAATLASSLQLQEQRREVICSFLALAMKLGFVALSAGSLVKVCIAYHQRLDRHGELASILNVESAKLINLQKALLDRSRHFV